MNIKSKQKISPLRRGWTTGACATAATKAAYIALLSGNFTDPIAINLPKGENPSFALALEGLGQDNNGKYAQAAIIKDAGDDPDVTHGALIIVEIRHSSAQSGISFKAGDGVGMVTRKGLPIEVGQAAINPVPRQMMQDVITEIAQKYQVSPDVEITISIPDGNQIAQQTWNPRLGIIGGLSILGTTGIVHPFSCSAWIASIHQGINVAQAAGLKHVAGSTGSMSEKAVKNHHNLGDIALIDMGDFAGGMLKHLRNNPIERVTVSGGFAKMCKLAMGFADLHSGRSQVDFNWLAEQFKLLDASPTLQEKVKTANTALECLNLAHDNNIKIALHIAKLAQVTAQKINRDNAKIDILICNRNGDIIAHKE